MITEKRIALKPILESKDGVHLTAYLVNRGDLIDIKSQLRETLDEAYEYLYSVFTIDERRKFLEPLNSLLHDARIFTKMKGNIGIFRTKESFRIINIPFDLERQCHVANSFHIKPILKWMQFDREFMILGLTNTSAHLYLGNQNSLNKIDTIEFSNVFKHSSPFSDFLSFKMSKRKRLRREEALSWIGDWLQHLTQKSSPKLFLAGDKFLVGLFTDLIKYKNVVRRPLSLTFNEAQISEICSTARRVMLEEAKAKLEQSLMEFRFADDTNLAKRNIFQIAKAAVQGKVRKLIVADSIYVFGKVNKKTGDVKIHPFDLDHEDDDILDDLAQTVLAAGGEVVITPREDIPKGRPILAILNKPDSGFEKEAEQKPFESERERSIT